MTAPQNLPQLDLYEDHLRQTISWIQLSIDKGSGGSSAHYSPLKGWASPYPETSGYILTTLIDAAKHLNDEKLLDDAVSMGHWLLKLQHKDGWWPGGLYKKSNKHQPSVFNSAQIVDGMVSLAEATNEDVWLNSAKTSSRWLAQGVDKDGFWQNGNYQSGFNPSYYSQVAWPMLRYWKKSNDLAVREAAERALKRIVNLRTSHGSIAGWGFQPGKPAFTHTIAYTIRGCIESAYLLDCWEEYGAPVEQAINLLAQKSEFSSGRLPGAFMEDWTKTNWYSCLTGNAQIALCILRYENHINDLRLVNSAAKLVDYVCSKQQISGGRISTRGAVAGSYPLWGRYMSFRYPNWAAKYHADALMMLRSRIQQHTNSHE